MPAVLQALIFKVSTGGPYAYMVLKDGLGVKPVTGLATVTAALNSARDEIAALVPGGEEVKRVSVNVTTNT